MIGRRDRKRRPATAAVGSSRGIALLLTLRWVIVVATLGPIASPSSVQRTCWSGRIARPTWRCC